MKQGGEEVERTLDLHVAKKVIAAKGRRALSPKTRGAYRAVVCNQVWTAKRLEQSGYDNMPWCKLGERLGEIYEDTLYHRWWQCKHPEVVAIRKNTVSKELERRAMREPNCPLFSRGIPYSVADKAIGPPCPLLQDMGVCLLETRRTHYRQSRVVHAGLGLF